MYGIPGRDEGQGKLPEMPDNRAKRVFAETLNALSDSRLKKLGVECPSFAKRNRIYAICNPGRGHVPTDAELEDLRAFLLRRETDYRVRREQIDAVLEERRDARRASKEADAA